MADPKRGEYGVLGHFAKFDQHGNLIDLQFGSGCPPEQRARVRAFYSKPPQERSEMQFPPMQEAPESQPTQATSVHTIELSEVDYETLVFVLGYATGAAMREDNRRLANVCVHLANAVNKHNPAWTSYEEERKR